MTKDDLIKLLPNEEDAEEYYMNCGPDKHEQEDHYTNGVSVIEMNVGLLTGWLSDYGKADGAFYELSQEEQRDVWEASNFHFGIYGYDKRDVDFYFGTETTSSPTNTDSEVLRQFFVDNWDSNSLRDDCHSAAINGQSLEAIRETYINGNKYVQLALRIGVIDERWIDDLFSDIKRMHS